METEFIVLNQEQYDGGRFPFAYNSLLDDVIKCLNDIRDEIPEKYRAIAECEIDSVGSYEDTHYARIKISYRRQMAEEEKSGDEREEAMRKQANLDWEKRRYEEALQSLANAK